MNAATTYVVARTCTGVTPFKVLAMWESPMETFVELCSRNGLWCVRSAWIGGVCRRCINWRLWTSQIGAGNSSDGCVRVSLMRWCRLVFGGPARTACGGWRENGATRRSWRRNDGEAGSGGSVADGGIRVGDERVAVVARVPVSASLDGETWTGEGEVRLDLHPRPSVRVHCVFDDGVTFGAPAIPLESNPARLAEVTLDGRKVNGPRVEGQGPGGRRRGEARCEMEPGRAGARLGRQRD